MTTGISAKTGARRIGPLMLDPDHLGELDELPDGVRDMTVLGRLLVEGDDGDEILLDERTGRIWTSFFFDDRQAEEPRPLAPDLDTLVRRAEAVEELAAPGGPFGERVVAEATRMLLDRLGEGVEPFWEIAARIRPLARIAGPGKDPAGGLALELPEGLLDREFGPGGVVRFEELDFPAALTHEPTRRFLCEVGLPEDGFLFSLDTDVPLPTLAESAAEDGSAYPARLPPEAGRLVRLGYLIDDVDLVVDGADGRVLGWFPADGVLRPVNTDLSTLAFTLWLLNREKAIDDACDFTTDSYALLAEAMTRVLAQVDPMACEPAGGGAGGAAEGEADDDWRYWPEVFADEAGGVL